MLLVKWNIVYKTFCYIISISKYICNSIHKVAYLKLLYSEYFTIVNFAEFSNFDGYWWTIMSAYNMTQKCRLCTSFKVVGGPNMHVLYKFHMNILLCISKQWHRTRINYCHMHLAFTIFSTKNDEIQILQYACMYL